MGWPGEGTASGLFAGGGAACLGASLAGAGDGFAGGREVVKTEGMRSRKPTKAIR
jgi:hypothetical protein